MLKHISWLFMSMLLLSSCTTILNSKTTKVKIYAPEHSKIIYKKDTLVLDEAFVKIHPIRSKDSLSFEVLQDSITAQFNFKRKTSGLLFLNIPYTYGLGILVDLTNEKRFTYPHNIRFVEDSSLNQLYTTKEKIAPFKRNTIFIYTSPLRAIDVFSRPTVTLGTEYFPRDNFSVSAEYGMQYIYPNSTSSNSLRVKDQGHSLRFEIKYYNLLHLSSNPNINDYIGLEARFLRTQFTDNIDYIITNEDLSFYRNEPIIVQKQANIFNLKYGLNLPIGKALYFDVYGGFGLRFKQIKNPNRMYNPDIHNLMDDYSENFFNEHILEETGNQNHFNVSLGFKFGVKL
ncbi:hypothetical protein [Sediminibacter sp. Hel_I_10]|uniref:hypothetical protein n=1 Tax=Sediminibacter sp. Hel_I_10 TaxID=1392490 RepID=UPI00047B0FB9|nr:hypothetical protein [Sediminibacter sp. Hel_I_10]